MFKWCLIAYWLDQFDENPFGIIFPKYDMLAEYNWIFGILDFLIFDSFDELESIRLMLIWIELDWISNWTKIPKSLCWPNACNALMSWIFDFVTLDVCEII